MNLDSFFDTPRYKLFEFYKKYQFFAILMCSLWMFIFLISWTVLFSIPFSLSIINWGFILMIYSLASWVIAYYSFPKIRYTGAQLLVSVRAGKSLYEQIEYKPRIFYHIFLFIATILLLDIFIFLAQMLQLGDSFMKNNIWFLIFLILRYCAVITSSIVYIFLYKKNFPEKPLYTPLLLT